MVVFIIPVKSKKVSSSWEKFSKLFERTLKSVCNQTDSNFKVVVVCHEKPITKYTHSNLEYLQVDFEPPDLKNSDKAKHDGLKEEDKSKKILKGSKYSEKFSPSYLMVVDADDCISNKIVTFVKSNMEKNSPGWYSKKGYIYREGDRFISLNKENFNTLCGTCIIIKPEYIIHLFQQVPHMLYVHRTTNFGESFALEPLPFPAAVYSMDNGENHFMNKDMIKNLNSNRIISLRSIKSIIRKLKKYRPSLLNRKLKNEFGIYHVALK